MTEDTITDIRARAYREMFDFINWLAEKSPQYWKEICEEYTREKKEVGKTMTLKCGSCNIPVSSKVPNGTTLRAAIICPECLRKENK